MEDHTTNDQHIDHVEHIYMSYNAYFNNNHTYNDAEEVLHMRQDTHPFFLRMLCQCINLYTYKFDGCLTAFLNNDFNVNSDIRNRFIKCIKYEEENSPLRLQYINDLDINIMRLYDRYYQYINVDVLVNHIIQDKYYIQRKYDNVQGPQSMAQYFQNNSTIEDVSVIFVCLNQQVIGYGGHYFTDTDIESMSTSTDVNVTQLLERLNHVNLIIGRVLFNMYIFLMNGFITIPRPIVLYSGLGRRSIERNYSSVDGSSYLITKRIVSTSIDYNIATRFLKCDDRDGYDIPVLFRVFVHQGGELLPLNDECRSTELADEKELLVKYGETFKILRLFDSMCLIEQRYSYDCATVNYEEFIQEITNIGQDIPHHIYGQLRQYDNREAVVMDHNRLSVLQYINHIVSIVNGGSFTDISYDTSYTVIKVKQYDLRFAKSDEILLINP